MNKLLIESRIDRHHTLVLMECKILHVPEQNASPLKKIDELIPSFLQVLHLTLVLL